MFYANALIGAVTVPVNTRFKPAELKYCLEQSDSVLLATVDRFLDKIDFLGMVRGIEPAVDTRLPGTVLPRLRTLVVIGRDIPAGALSYSAFQGQAGVGALIDRVAVAAAAAAVTPDDAVLIQYTSGTTSFPKGAMLSHANMLRDAAAVARRIGVKVGDRYFSARPFYHVAGTTLSILVALSAGACLLTTPTFDAGESLRIMARERCALVSGNDTMFLMMMGHPDFDPATLCLRGGWGAAGPEVMRQIMTVMGARELCFAYGLSEASPNVVISAHDEPLEVRVSGLALPHDGTALRIIDPETGTDRPAETPGEILVRGWNIMKGYYNMPEKTAEAIDADGWLHTGDLGALTADGRLRFIGRVKDMFRVGGENVAPAEVEEVLHAHPKVEHSQVIGVPDARLGEVAAAYVRLKPGVSAEPDEFVAWCRERCANFKVPRYVKIVDSFESIGMTGSAKVQKTKLRAQALIDFGLEKA